MKKKSVINEFGEKYYHFNEQKELEIYNCLCFRKTKKKCDIEYHTYSDWKNYIYNNYSEYTKEQLIEFSRFLNQKIRNVEPGHEYWNIMIPIIMTVTVDKLFETIVDVDQSYQATVPMIIIEMLIIIFTVAISSIFVNKIIEPLFDTCYKENFYKDYKEIIDEIISNK